MFKFSIEVTISASDESSAGQQMNVAETALKTHAPGVLAVKLVGSAERCTKQEIMEIVRSGAWNSEAKHLVARLDAAPDDKDAEQADSVVDRVRKYAPGPLRMLPQDEQRFEDNLAAISKKGMVLARWLQFLAVGRVWKEEDGAAPLYVEMARKLQDDIKIRNELRNHLDSLSSVGEILDSWK